MKLLEGKVCIITGATRGIGKGIAELFAKNGADIAFTYMSSDIKAKELEIALKENGINAKGYKSNAGEYAACEELVANVLEDFGGRIDVVLNNAGVTKDNLLMRMTEEMWDDVMNINLKSVFNMTKAVQRTLLKQRSGSIINMSSVVGISGNAGQSNYAASKAGILGFTRSIAQELGSRSIRCNAIAPGFIETEMTGALPEETVQEWRNAIPLKRGGTPEDVANMAMFLASDMSTYVTGQTLNVDGGMLTH
ncbi:MAG: 3-oxoacyl-[acyl-carrier-protein] reductase [Salibacteraceae bacterium]